MPEETPQLRVMHQLGSTYRALLSAFDAATQMPMPRWRILLKLFETDGLSQKQLALDLRMDPAALTRQLKAIEKLDWVRRQADARDNRVTNVWLTPAGIAVVNDVMPRRTAFIESSFTDFSAEQLETMSALLIALEARLKSGTPPDNA